MSKPTTAPRLRTLPDRLRLGSPLVLAMFLGSFALTACGRGAAAEPTGYFAQTPDRLVFVEWTRPSAAAGAEEKLAGSATMAVTDAIHFQVTAETASIAGTLKGSAVSLTLSQALDSSTSWQGTLTGALLTLSYTNGDGLTVTLSLRTASRSVFNAALVKEQEDMQALAEGTTTKKGESKEEAAVDKWSSIVRADLAKLAKDAAAPAAAAADATSAANAATSDQQLAHHYMSAALAKKYGPQICPLADQSSAYANSTSGESSAASAAQDQVDALAGTVRKDITILSADDGKLAAAESAAPKYKPKKLPSDKDVTDAITAANAAITDAQHTANGAASAAARKASTAQSDAGRAQAKCASAPQSK